MVTPGEVLGKASELKAGRGAYVATHNNTVYASLTGRRSLNSPPPDSPDKGFRFKRKMGKRAKPCFSATKEV
ncbi:hypothetical protein Acr_24g0005810 [Actinidia rufa]|uniref:Exosome complex component N-terminal domain-containing protein n=1 Tax=Actinidia rufa TaxID=165716 RepID=A0A7J0GUH9_9ERIC|nr:hypothetical protein Acr_24g0005810 [Actinidia rufa]